MLRPDKAVKMTLQSLNSSKIRSALTALGIIIGIAAVVTTFSIGDSYGSFFETQVGGVGNNFIVIIATKENIFRMSHLQIIESTPGISGVSPALTVNSEMEFMGERKSVQVNGVHAEMIDVANLEMLEGNFLVDSDQFSAVVSRQIAQDDMKNEIHTRHTIDLIIPDVDGNKKTYQFKVKGIQGLEGEQIVGGHNANTIYVPLQTLREITGNTSFNMFFAMADSKEDIDEVSEEVEKRLSRSMGISERKLDEEDVRPFRTVNQAEIVRLIQTVTAGLVTFLVGIGAISLLVGSVGIMNIMLVSVTERTTEIGLLKAVGYAPKDILLIFITESAILTVLGGIAGTILGLTVAYIGTSLLSMTLKISLTTVSIGFFVSLFVGIIAGAYPAYRAAKMNPVDALSKE